MEMARLDSDIPKFHRAFALGRPMFDTCHLAGAQLAIQMILLETGIEFQVADIAHAAANAASTNRNRAPPPPSATASLGS
jgi:hypothetical protein